MATSFSRPGTPPGFCCRDRSCSPAPRPCASSERWSSSPSSPGRCGRSSSAAASSGPPPYCWSAATRTKRRGGGRGPAPGSCGPRAPTCLRTSAPSRGCPSAGPRAGRCPCGSAIPRPCRRRTGSFAHAVRLWVGVLIQKARTTCFARRALPEFGTCLGGRCPHQSLPDRPPPALEGKPPLAALEAAVRPSHQAVELPRKLLGVGVGVDVPRLLRLHDRALQAVRPVGLLRQDGVPDRTGAPAVVLLGDSPEEAAAGKHAALEVGQPRVAQRPHAPDATRLGKRRANDLGGEDLRRRLDGREVQLLFGAEVGEQPALADAEVVGEALKR